MKKVLYLIIFILVIYVPQCANADDILKPAEPEVLEEYDATIEGPIQSLEGHLEYNDEQEQSKEDSDSIKLNFEERKQINILSPQHFSFETTKMKKSNDNFAIFNSRIEPASKFSTQEYMIAPMSQSLCRRNGKFSYGTAYNSYLDSAEINYQSSIFTKYDTKRFSITTAYARNTGNDYSNYKDKVYFVPEWKVTNRLSILDVLQSDTDMMSKSNEL